ncbi:serine/threonine-protein kinase [Leptolyngbya sp. FACHB-261]|uniref:serine/threonine-protein kinase n=1 Tax=Leptolyngbya sp. FACHB-261 TaxID=2692806 RepID=UPI001689ABEB|nr:serine/threonine-protein kinase [Leptolyngbya sp. FACHB-261]MBD2102448.1 protein kinase [Leptolyngbya sp. FACHB-261]
MPTSVTDPLQGQVFAGRYRLVSLLGQGGMGRVYRAEDQQLGNTPVAVKLLTQIQSDGTDTLQTRFEREAHICALLSHRSLHIVRVSDYGMGENQVPFYVMECLEGPNLRELIARRRLPLTRFLALARQICAGLQVAHEGIKVNGSHYPVIHRDLKPSNIVVIPDTTLDELVKILDFGIAKFVSEQGTLSLQTTSYVGTLAYSSPEQMQGLPLDARSDLYSLGIILYEMLTGVLPLQSSTHSFAGWYHAHQSQEPRTFEAVGLSRQLPPVLEDLVMACLAKNPQDRPQSAAEVLATLKSLGNPVPAAPPELSDVDAQAATLPYQLPQPTPGPTASFARNAPATTGTPTGSPTASTPTGTPTATGPTLPIAPGQPAAIATPASTPQRSETRLGRWAVVALAGLLGLGGLTSLWLKHPGSSPPASTPTPSGAISPAAPASSPGASPQVSPSGAASGPSSSPSSSPASSSPSSPSSSQPLAPAAPVPTVPRVPVPIPAAPVPVVPANPAPSSAAPRPSVPVAPRPQPQPTSQSQPAAPRPAAPAPVAPRPAAPRPAATRVRPPVQSAPAQSAPRSNSARNQARNAARAQARQQARQAREQARSQRGREERSNRPDKPNKPGKKKDKG